MRKRVVVVGVILGILLFGLAGNGSETQSNYSSPAASTQTTQSQIKSIHHAEESTSKKTTVCDGRKVIEHCEFDGVNYRTYVYHPATPETYRTETVTTYQEQITGYCTLCVDGTYSPSCATGRGACSHHGGVAQWNAPIYNRVPVRTKQKVIDTPAKKAYYEKVIIQD